MNILGFNPTHHGSVCLLQDGKIKHFIQEERIGIRKKYRDIPFRGFIDILENYKIDIITWSCPSITFKTTYSNNPYWYDLAQSFYPNIQYYDLSHIHHNIHGAHAFYNSGFNEAICLVVDGIGSIIGNNEASRETETIFYCSYPDNFKVLYKNVILAHKQINLSRAYETITMHLGWDRNEAGKTMGLAPYGKYNSNFPPFFINRIGNPDIFYSDFHKESNLPNQNQTFVNEEKNPQLKLQIDPREWHYNKLKITDLEKDLAWKIQNDTQQIVGDYIEKSIKETGLKQVCCAGGYFLNCVTNYYLQKRFPDIKFYFEPIANDAGMAIGAAKLVWHKLTQDTTIHSLKSLYLGPPYAKKQLSEGIKKYVSN